MTNPTRIPYGPESSQFADLRVPDCAGPHPLVIVIHGGFWRERYGLEETDAIASDLTRAGYATWNIEYRRVGQPGGGWPGTLQDVARGTDHLSALQHQLPLDRENVLALGHSAGGHLALWLASRWNLPAANGFVQADSVRLAGVISLAGICDLAQMANLGGLQNPVVEFLGSSPEEFPDRYAAASPAQAGRISVPQILLHGDADDRVPFDLSRNYAERAQAAGCDVKLIKLPNTGHFEFLRVNSPAWAQSLAAAKELSARFQESRSHR